MGEKDWLAEFKNIKEIVKRCQKDIPQIPKGLEKLLEEDPITVEDAKLSLISFCDGVKESNIDERQIALHVNMLETRMGLLRKHGGKKD